MLVFFTFMWVGAIVGAVVGAVAMAVVTARGDSGPPKPPSA